MLFAALSVAVLAAAAPARLMAVVGSPAVVSASAGTVDAAPAPSMPEQSGQAAQAAEQGKEAVNSGWFAVIAKAFNFALLVAILVYFLKAPLLSYLNGRITRVRQDLVAAAETRDAASRQLDDIHAKLKVLPAEIEALKRRGAEDIAAERVRIEEAAEIERQRLLQQTAREIEMKFRVARRELIEHAADLAVQLASDRVRASMTADDQARLFDRYTAQLQAGSVRS